MRRLLSTVLVSLLALVSLGAAGTAGSAGARQGSGPLLLRVYDLNGVQPSFDAEDSWVSSLLVSQAETPGKVPAVGSLDGKFFDALHQRDGAEAVAALLTELLGDELHYEGRDFQMDVHNQLYVVAPESVHGRIRGFLDAIGGVLSGAVEITVDVVSLDGGSDAEQPLSGILDPAQAERLLSALAANGADRRTLVLDLQAGRTAWSDTRRAETFVYDYDVEIAQGMLIFDPIVHLAETGLTLLMCGVPMEDGVAMTVVLRGASEAGGVVETALEFSGLIGNEQSATLIPLPAPSFLQSSRSLIRSLAVDTFLPNGKTLVASSTTRLGTDVTRQLIFLRRSGGELSSFRSIPMEGSSRQLVAINSELLGPPRLSVLDDGATSGHPRMSARVDAEPPFFLFDWIGRRFSVWRRVGPWALVLTNPTHDAGTLEELSSLIANRRVAIETANVEVGLRGETGAPRVLTSVPIRIGSRCASIVGITETAIVDYTVEVAQRSSVADPVVRPLFDGLAIVVEPHRGSSGDVSVSLTGRAHLQEGAPSSVDLGSPGFGQLHQTREGFLRVEGRAIFPAGEGRPQSQDVSGLRVVLR